MDYEVTLIEADIEGPMRGKMVLGLAHEGGQTARVEYSWTDKEFAARFVGNAAVLPVPAHPTTFISAPIAAIQALKAQPTDLPTSVFQNHKVFINVA
ncbi:MAG: hypothetical protein COA62_04955 [Rhodobiaceae bacterium]|nr:MAG: hypothetical protein COA62_04955 [Rhodobiaceae bacterium]